MNDSTVIEMSVVDVLNELCPGFKQLSSESADMFGGIDSDICFVNEHFVIAKNPMACPAELGGPWTFSSDHGDTFDAVGPSLAVLLATPAVRDTLAGKPKVKKTPQWRTSLTPSLSQTLASALRDLADWLDPRE